MIKINEIGKKPGMLARSSAKTVLLLVLALSVSGCYYKAANRDFTRPGGTTPWWCTGGSPALTQEECLSDSLLFDAAIYNNSQYATLDTFIAVGGAEITDRPDNIGVAFTNTGPTPDTFAPNAPNVLLYDGSLPTSRLVGIAWEIDSVTAPEGFDGNRDVWTQNATTGHWWLTAWVMLGYENQPNVFAAAHPCLTSTGTILTSTQDQCFQDSHTEPFEVVVTNDDGYNAPGIDALVEGLYAQNFVVHVVAPSANQSGVGGATTGAGYTVSGSAEGLLTTLSGKPATAVTSDDPAREGIGSPADSVMYALTKMKLTPELVVSGINAGQNMSEGVSASGTVGAARAARSRGVPSIASSQGRLTAPWDFPTGTAATLALIEEWRLGHTVHTNSSVLNINIPTCASGLFPRGTLQTVVAVTTGARNYLSQNCSSTVEPLPTWDDVDVFNNGYIGITNAGVKKPPNWP